jgi:tRNA threonylcarbamoyladenosine biosynthesis protein TsaB
MLVPLVAALLKECECERSEIRAVAVSAGPGSYTGLRIGVSTAKGMASGLGIDLIAVPTLDGLAFAAWSAGTNGNRAVAAVLPARGDEVYARVYVEREGMIAPVSPAEAVDLASLADRMSRQFGHQWMLASPDPAAWSKRLPSDVTRISVEASAEWVLHASARQGVIVDAETFEPYYIKPFVARAPSRSAFDRLEF